MKPFNGHINVEGETLQFTFYDAHTDRRKTFFVSVTRHGQPGTFNMIENDSGKWILVEPVAEWLKPLEGRLANIITQNI